jgi:hypothetical protein
MEAEKKHVAPEQETTYAAGATAPWSAASSIAVSQIAVIPTCGVQQPANSIVEVLERAPVSLEALRRAEWAQSS